jgi:two-component system sensor histidine kinase BaeS
VDWYYLSGLSADAVPTLVKLPPADRYCVLREFDREKDSWAGWNLSRARADEEMERIEASLEAEALTSTRC